MSLFLVKIFESLNLIIGNARIAWDTEVSNLTT